MQNIAPDDPQGNLAASQSIRGLCRIAGVRLLVLPCLRYPAPWRRWRRCNAYASGACAGTVRARELVAARCALAGGCS